MALLFSGVGGVYCLVEYKGRGGTLALISYVLLAQCFSLIFLHLQSLVLYPEECPEVRLRRIPSPAGKSGPPLLFLISYSLSHCHLQCIFYSILK